MGNLGVLERNECIQFERGGGEVEEDEGEAVGRVGSETVKDKMSGW